MRLHRHDELVEAMEDAIALVGPYGTDKIRATAALDALLEAAVRLEVGRQAGHVIRNEMWNAFEGNHVDGTPQCLILRAWRPAMTTHDEDIESVAARVQHLRADLEWGCELREKAAALIRRLRDERDEALNGSHERANELRKLLHGVRNKALDEAAAVARHYEPRCDACPSGVTNAILALKSQEPKS